MADDTGMLVDVEPAEASDRKETWKRGLFMLLCVFAFWVGQTLLILLAIVTKSHFLGRVGLTLYLQELPAKSLGICDDIVLIFGFEPDSL